MSDQSQTPVAPITESVPLPKASDAAEIGDKVSPSAAAASASAVHPLFETPKISPPKARLGMGEKSTDDHFGRKKTLKILIAGTAAFFILVSALIVGLYLVNQQGVGEIRKLAGTGWCNADSTGTDYGSPCQVQDPNHNECGGDGKQTYCGIGSNPDTDRRTTGTWHATGNCCEEPTPGEGSMSCTTISTDKSHLEIRVSNDTSNDRSYQLNKCECNSKNLPCDRCNYSQPGLDANTSRSETLDLDRNCGSVQLDVSPINNEFTACYAWYSSGVNCVSPTLTPVPSQTPTPTLTITLTPTPETISANCESLLGQILDGAGGWITKTDVEFAAAARPGDGVRFVCTGHKTQGNFTKSAFFINSVLHVDDVVKLNDTQFAVEYTIPAAGALTVESVLLHDSKGWVD